MRMEHPGYAIAPLILGCALSARAQTCDSPIEITSSQGISGNTCNSTINLPYVANGAIALAGEDVVYHVATVNPFAGQVSLQPDSGVDLAMFVCRHCSTYATCIAAVDNGPAASNVANVPAGTADYYIIVGATTVASATTCGSYTLQVAYPLDD